MLKFLSVAAPLACLFAPVYAHAGQCVDLTIPVTVTSENLVPAYAPFENNYESQYFFNLVTQRNGNISALYSGKVNITKTFSISAQYCTPSKKSRKSSTVQLLTHGLGFEKSYWNFTRVPGDYSYTAAALEEGYATFSYDRVGTGLSSYDDPYTVVQAPLELQVLIELTKIVRAGQFIGDKPSKVVHVGHSFGSELTQGLAASVPTLTDGIILTGYSTNGSFKSPWLSTSGHTARTNQPERFFNYSSGYVTWNDVYYNEYSFLAYPYFDPAVAEAAEANKWPFAVGEVTTADVLPSLAPEYKGPVLFLAAQRDLIFCGYDCTGIIDGPYSTARKHFPAVSDFSVYIQPNVAHAINLHYNATGAYAVANKWLEKNKL